jgi:phospholipid transport system substrate-binding protein
MFARWSLYSLLAFSWALAIPATSQASATDEVRNAVNDVVRIVGDKEMKKPQNDAKRRKSLKAAIGSIFDYDEMTRRTMATHWKGRTPAEKKEFTGLFETLLENSYAGKIESYNNEKIIYQKEIIDGEYAEVKSKLVTPKRDEYQLDYRLMKKGGKWMVYDVVIEGVSLVSNYRTQFNKVISSQGYPELVRKLKAKSKEISLP